MIVSIGVQILVVVALALAVLLVGYTFYVRIRQSTFTEKRFNFVALWSCSVVVLLALHAVVHVPIIDALLANVGLSIAPLDTPSKIIVALIAGFYVWSVARWARSWNGLISEEGYRAREQSVPTFFVVDGARETWRIIRGNPPSPVHVGRSPPAPQLPPPLSELAFHEQVRDLIMGRWPEMVIDDDAWIADGSCWYGQDAALEQPLLVVCGIEESEVNLERVAELVAYRAENGRIRLLAVFDSFRGRAGFTEAMAHLSERSPDVYTFEELIVAAVPLARYKKSIDEEFRKRPLPGADFAIADVFVSSRASETTASGYDGKPLAIKGDPFDLEGYIADWTADGSLRHLALLGTYGQGKSTAALAFTHKLLHDRDFAAHCGNRIPLLIRLTGLSPKTSDPEGLLGQWGTRLGLNGRALLALHRAGRTVLILDAFDEMANVADRADRFDHFAALWQFACSGSKVLFTGRPNFFLDDEELKRALGISEGVAVGPYCSALRMAPFEPDQIEDSLRWMPSQKVATFMRAAERLPQILEIVRRPSLLFQLSRLWYEGRIDIEGDNVYSGEVIRKFVTYSLERQVQKQRAEVAHPFISLTLAELDCFTSGCAVAALSDGRNNSLPAPAFRDVVGHMLDALPEGGLPLSTGEGGALAMPLKERLKDRPDAIEACVQAVRTHGVIEHDPAKTGMYKFSHKSFAEALAAEVLVSHIVGLRDSLGFIWNVVGTPSLVRQDAVLLFSMDIAAANRSQARFKTGTAIISRMLKKYYLIANIIYRLVLTAFALVEYAAVAFSQLRRKHGNVDTEKGTSATARLGIIAMNVTITWVVVGSASLTFAILMFLFQDWGRYPNVAIFAAFPIAGLFVLSRALFALNSSNNILMEMVIYALSIEYAVRMPTINHGRRVFQFGILDVLVESRVASASDVLGRGPIADSELARGLVRD